MDITALVDIITNTGIWCALFVYLFYITEQDHKNREQQFYEFIQKQSEQLLDISNTLKSISERLDDLEERID